MPDHYDAPLGIGLESWTYPARVNLRPCVVGGETLRMAYMDIAPTAKPRNRTVVLMHGKNFDSSYWAGPIADLAGAGFRVVVPDQIGFNKSAKPDVPYSFDMAARHTLDLPRRPADPPGELHRPFDRPRMLAVRHRRRLPRQRRQS